MHGDDAQWAWRNRRNPTGLMFESGVRMGRKWWSDKLGESPSTSFKFFLR